MSYKFTWATKNLKGLPKWLNVHKKPQLLGMFRLNVPQLTDISKEHI